MSGERGQSLIETLAALAVLSLIAGLAAPSLSGLRQRATLSGAAAELAGTLRALRSRAIAEGRTVSLVFNGGPEGWRYQVFADGDGDGVRAVDIMDGVDYPLRGPERLCDRWPGVDFKVLPVARLRRIPPGTGWIDPPEDPIQFGAAKIVSFSPGGDASSGTFYLSDGTTGMAAVVIFGPTARLRVFRYELSREEWIT